MSAIKKFFIALVATNISLFYAMDDTARARELEKEAEDEHMEAVYTLFCNALRDGDVADLQSAFSQGAYSAENQESNINSVYSDFSPLLQAVQHCRKRRLEVVQLLFDKKADPNVADSYGYTPLMHCAQTGDGSIAGLLIRNKADVNKRGDATPLILAAEKNRMSTIRLLIDNKASVNDCVCSTGETALHIAVEQENRELLTVLMLAGANYNIARRTGASPWSRASDGMQKILSAAKEARERQQAEALHREPAYPAAEPEQQEPEIVAAAAAERVQQDTVAPSRLERRASIAADLLMPPLQQQSFALVPFAGSDDSDPEVIEYRLVPRAEDADDNDEIDEEFGGILIESGRNFEQEYYSRYAANSGASAGDQGRPTSQPEASAEAVAVQVNWGLKLAGLVEWNVSFGVATYTQQYGRIEKR